MLPLSGALFEIDPFYVVGLMFWYSIFIFTQLHIIIIGISNSCFKRKQRCDFPPDNLAGKKASAIS